MKNTFAIVETWQGINGLQNQEKIDCTESHLFSKGSLEDLPAAVKHLLDDCGSFFGAYR